MQQAGGDMEASDSEEEEEDAEDAEDAEDDDDDKRASVRGSTLSARSSKSSVQPTLTITTTIATNDATTQISRVVPAESPEAQQLSSGTLSTTVRRTSGPDVASPSSSQSTLRMSNLSVSEPTMVDSGNRLSLSSMYEELDGTSWTERRASRRRSKNTDEDGDSGNAGGRPHAGRPKPKMGFGNL
jgi:hypothetical protein